MADGGLRETGRRHPLALSEPTLTDRVVAYFDPVRGALRMRARAALALGGAWNAGRRDRRATQEWSTTGGSADFDNLWDLPTARDRSRDLCRNNPLALGAVNTVVRKVVGTGLSLKSCPNAEVLGITPEAALELAKTIQIEFNAWAGNPVACDAAKTLDFYRQQALALRSELEAGDVFATLPMIATKVSEFETKVLLIEGDRVRNKNGEQDTDEKAGGVEKDKYGAPIRYHILKKHPGGFRPTVGAEQDFDVVPAFGAKTGRRNVIHLFDQRRPGQSRGMPYLAPVVETLKQLSNYTEAEIMAAVVSGMFTAFVHTETGQGLAVGDTTGTTGTNAGDSVKMGNGAIVDLAPNEKVDFADPSRPNTAFDPFVQAVLRQVGVALEIPFELLVMHFTASYSASRAALLEAWAFFKGRRAHLAAGFCQPVYEAWFEEAVAANVIDAPGFFDDPRIRAAYLSSEWIGDAPGQIEPLKEVEAAARRIEAGLSNHAIETMQLHGLEWEDVQAVLAEETKRKKADGTMPEPAQVGPDGKPLKTKGAEGDEKKPPADEDEKALMRATTDYLKSRAAP